MPMAKRERTNPSRYLSGERNSAAIFRRFQNRSSLRDAEALGPRCLAPFAVTRNRADLRLDRVPRRSEADAPPLLHRSALAQCLPRLPGRLVRISALSPLAVFRDLMKFVLLLRL